MCCETETFISYQYDGAPRYWYLDYREPSQGPSVDAPGDESLIGDYGKRD